MRKEQIITTNNNQLEEKGMKNRFIHFKKRFVPAFTGSYADWAQTLTSKAAYIFHCKRSSRWRYGPSSLQVYRSYGFCLCGNSVCSSDSTWRILFF